MYGIHNMHIINCAIFCVDVYIYVLSMHVLSPNDLVSDSKPNRIVDTGVPIALRYA